MENSYTYDIGGKTYTQKALVLGQVKQLTKIVTGLEFSEDVDILSIIEMLGDKLPLAFAIILTEEGKSLKDKDLEACASELEFTVDVNVSIQVIEDFFVCNPTGLVFKKITEGIKSLLGKAEVQEEKLEVIEEKDQTDGTGLMPIV